MKPKTLIILGVIGFLFWQYQNKKTTTGGNTTTGGSTETTDPGNQA